LDACFSANLAFSFADIVQKLIIPQQKKNSKTLKGTKSKHLVFFVYLFVLGGPFLDGENFWLDRIEPRERRLSEFSFFRVTSEKKKFPTGKLGSDFVTLSDTLALPPS
jgi:hypothetical protein